MYVLIVSTIFSFKYDPLVAVAPWGGGGESGKYDCTYDLASLYEEFI